MLLSPSTCSLSTTLSTWEIGLVKLHAHGKKIQLDESDPQITVFTFCPVCVLVME